MSDPLCLAAVYEGEVGLGDVGRVAGLVHVLLAVEERLGEVLQLGSSLVTVLAATGHVGLVAASNVHQTVGDGSEEALLTGLVASGLVLLDHPLPLLLEVAHDVLPDLHEVDGLLEAVVIQAAGCSGFWSFSCWLLSIVSPLTSSGP